MKKFSHLNEDLRKWFDSSHPEGGWKRINSKGEAIGPCAREPGEPKPKCMSNEKRAALSKKERASAVRTKRKHDPNPERKGKPINVSNFGKGKLSEDMKQLDEKNVPTSPEKWAQAKAQAKAKFDVYPSAYANGWASKKYKEMGGGWKSVSEDVRKSYEDEPMVAFRKKQNEVPFDGPYKKTPTATDKSGAKHSPYSRVRHLARMAAQRQMEKTKKPVKEDVGQVDEGLADVAKKVKTAKNLAKFHYNYAKKIFKNPDAEVSDQEYSNMRKAHGLKENIQQIEEGRPSQRHPLAGHDYHKKTDAELRYITKDAHEAAEAMKGHNTKAENKYRDQVNDASTVLHFRKTSGTPDWYKKKYGHIKEELELDESLKTHYQNGYDAQKRGKTRKDNPHREGTPAASMWAKGWEHSSDKKESQKFTNEEVDLTEAKVGDTVSFHHELKAAPGSKVKKSGTVEKVDGDVLHVKVKDKYGVIRHQVKKNDLVKEEIELNETTRVMAKHGDVEVHGHPGDSDGHLVTVHKNGKKVAEGDYDRHAGAIWISHHSFGKGQKAFDSSKDVAHHFSTMKEDVDHLVELSNELLTRYKKKASEQASAADKAGNFKKGNKRFSGILKATIKQFDNDSKPMKRISEEQSEIQEQHREEGRFKPVVPQKVPNVSVSSRKADIVRSAAKKTAVVKDKFQSNPELTTSLTKNV